jgi:hypothetical protein
VQLTKDSVGICAPDLRLDNSTSIAQDMKNKDKLYLVNGIPTRGWFTVDFTLNELSPVSCEFGSDFNNLLHMVIGHFLVACLFLYFL